MPIVPYRLRLNNEPEITKRCTPQFNTDLISSTQKSVNSTNPLVQRKKPSVQHRKVSSTPKNKELFFVGFLCRTDAFLCWKNAVYVLHWRICVKQTLFFVEMTNLGGWKRVAFLCWTDVMNCLVCATAGDPVKIFGIFN